jgi:MFS transporter, DHA1 family, tetracycline resistance protein
LLSGYGIATMISEGILVRIIVPVLGEKNSMRLGLLAFAFQCITVAFASSPLWIFMSVLFSMLANLVYPSISSLVSKLVDEDVQGEALGALNGIKALTEGFGPLIFGLLMALFEDAPLPGAPYLVACIISFWAFLHCYELPPEPDEILAAKFSASVKGSEEAVGLLSDQGNHDDDDDGDEER